MSNARNLADVISGAFDVPAGALDNAPSPTLTSLGIANHNNISVDSSGRMTNSNTPLFMGNRNGRSSITTNYTYIDYQAITNAQNNGNHWDGTSTFTCPVNGYYLCSYQSMNYSGDTTADHMVELKVNNTNVGISTYCSGGSTAPLHHLHHGFTGVVYCSANDTIRFMHNTGYTYSGTYSTAMIILIS
jgi:hypothetical protein